MTNDNLKELIRAREDVYERLFGLMQHVWHERTSEDPHIDVYCFKPGHAGRDFYTLVTGGMSSREMALPKGLPDPMRMPRIELVFYCKEPKKEYAEFLRRLAHYPFDNKTWFGAGHTMSTTDIGLLDDERAETILFLPTPVIPDDSIPLRLQVDGEPVMVLCVIPMTEDECGKVRAPGRREMIFDYLRKRGRPLVFGPPSV